MQCFLGVKVVAMFTCSPYRLKNTDSMRNNVEPK